MKKLFIRVVSLTLMLALVLSMPVVALADSIDLDVKITREDELITVEVDDSEGSNNILAQNEPTLTIPCSFDEAYVQYGDKVVNSTLAGGKITFTVAKGGEYQIIKGSVSAGCTGCGSTDQYHEEDCEAIAPANAMPLYAYNLDDKKTYTSISTSNNMSIPVIFKTGNDESAVQIPVDHESRFAFAGEGIDLYADGDIFRIMTGAYGVSSGKIVYTAEDGTVYVLQVVVTENKRLIAVDANGNYTELQNISTTPVDVTICYGTTTDYEEIPLDKLTTGGVAELEGSGTNYKISATGAGEGGIYYDNDGYIEKLDVTGGGKRPNGSLTAKNSDGEGMSWPWIEPNSSEQFKLFFAEEELTSMTVLSAGGVATIAYADGMFSIGAGARGRGDIYYTVDDYTYSYAIIGESTGSGGSGSGGEPGPGGPGQPGPGGAMTEGSVEVEYNGQTVKVGLGNIWNEAVEFFFMLGDSFEAGSEREFTADFYVLAVAVDPNDPTKTTDVDEAFYSTISNVRLTKVENAGAGSADNLQLSTPAKSDQIVSGADVWGFTASAGACKSFNANVECTFDYREKPNADPETITLTIWLSFEETKDIIVGELTQGEEQGDDSMPDNCLNTAEELNFVLSSNENLFNWIEYHYHDKFKKINRDASIKINLPDVVYDDVIEDKTQPYGDTNPFGGLVLNGSSSDGKRTTMPGLISGKGIVGISGISFEANGKTMRFADSEPFTCGILVDAGSTSGFSTGWISDCSFQGFNYGVYYTKHGVKPDLFGCLIRDCDYGLYINSAGLREIDFPLSVTENRFVGCEKAVVVAGLPQYFSPYYLRIYNNAFLFNDTEFDMDVSGTFFFKLNYYGGHSRGNGVYKNWTPDKKGDAEIRHAARLDITYNGSTKVITNPCLKQENHTGGYWLYNNHGDAENQHTAILNSEADQILIDSGAFNQNSSESQVAILDENQNEMAMWIFDGEEAAE